MKLMTPSLEFLPSYKEALARGWSPDNTRPIDAPREELEKIAQDPEAFVASMTDREAAGEDITLPDGSKVKRLPGYRMWMWDEGSFCGSIGFRWEHGTSELPPHCLGHIGYAVPEWKQRRGYATRGLGLMLPLAKAEGLDYVYITTDPLNIASQKVIATNGGTLIKIFDKGPIYGNAMGHLYRIDL
jgi:predicted acetyltransferase